MSALPVTLIVPVDHRLELLPYHVAYYSRLGVRDFVYALWNGRSNPVYPELLDTWKRCAPRDARYFDVQTSLACDYDRYSGPAEIPGLNAIRKDLLEQLGPEAWYCLADLDEFYAFDAPSLPAFVAKLEAGGYRAAGGVFHDRISAESHFPAIPAFDPKRAQLDELFPLAADLTKQAHASSDGVYRPANTTKVGLARMDVAIHSGHHYVEIPAEQQMKDGLECHHFKWHAGIVGLLPRRLEAYRAQGLTWAGESAWFMDFFKQPNWAQTPCLNARPARRLGI